MYESLIHEVSKLIKFRYSLILLFYSLGFQAYEDGYPIIRPLIYEF